MNSSKNQSRMDGVRDWRMRLNHSRDLGTGFAAPGGEFTRALYEWSFTPKGKILHSILKGRRVVELGAGMMSYGYELASACEAKNFVAVEPFYSDIQTKSILASLSEANKGQERIPYKVVGQDMLTYLQSEPDDLLCIIACGIEDCILPGYEYRGKVEKEIIRTMENDSFFISSHTDLYPKELEVVEFSFSRLSNPSVTDRIRFHAKKHAFYQFEEKLRFLY